MQLRPEALNALKLPVKVKAGFLGSVRLKVGEINLFKAWCRNCFSTNIVAAGFDHRSDEKFFGVELHK